MTPRDESPSPDALHTARVLADPFTWATVAMVASVQAGVRAADLIDERFGPFPPTPKLRPWWWLTWWAGVKR